MIVGTVTKDGVPTITLTVAGRRWLAVVDSGFNGDLELPESFRSHVNPRFLFRAAASLAGGVTVLEDLYLVDFFFDGREVEAEATFVNGDEILIGTQLLGEHRLEIDFVARTVKIERALQSSPAG